MLPLSTLIQPTGSSSGSGPNGSGPVVNPSSSTVDPSFVTFRKATYAVDAHGGPAPTYPSAVTMLATVKVSGVPTRVSDHQYSEPRPLARTTFLITTSEDPAAYLGSGVVTDDLIDWGGETLTVIGKTFPQGTGGYETVAELIS